MGNINISYKMSIRSYLIKNVTSVVEKDGYAEGIVFKALMGDALFNTIPLQKYECTIETAFREILRDLIKTRGIPAFTVVDAIMNGMFDTLTMSNTRFWLAYKTTGISAGGAMSEKTRRELYLRSRIYGQWENFKNKSQTPILNSRKRDREI